MISLYFPVWALFGYRVKCRNPHIFFRIFSLSDVISPDSFLLLIIMCLFLSLLIRLGPFIASNISCINSFLFFRPLVLRYFFAILLSSACSTLSFSVLFAFCHNSFFILSKLLISVSSVLFLIVEGFFFGGGVFFLLLLLLLLFVCLFVWCPYILSGYC